MKQLKALLIISSLLVGCAKIPTKPSVTLCVIDFPSNEAICGTTLSQELESVKRMDYANVVMYIKGASDVHRVPLSSMDHAIAFTPPEWEKVKNYMDDLMDYAKKNCK